MRILAFAIISSLAVPSTSLAQFYASPDIIGPGLIGQSAMEVTRRDMEKRSGKPSEANQRAKKATPARKLERCTQDHIPAAEFASLKAKYQDILRRYGKATAEDWNKRQSKASYKALTSAGICR
ncbi:MAG: hypothetical protein DI498_01935 [Paracoccus denitrificans]|nr:MAG: hypothetical protein DI498_01935 [Paracoccus denitrificans]PZO85918.1 MAG: hypothetical protein DI633_01935 [Paracoccus denitrificans]